MIIFWTLDLDLHGKTYFAMIYKKMKTKFCTIPIVCKSHQDWEALVSIESLLSLLAIV